MRHKIFAPRALMVNMSRKLKQIRTFGIYTREKFHSCVRKVPISLDGFTCPNIDGKVARGGCTYCDNSSFSPNVHYSHANVRRNDAILSHQLAQIDTQFKAFKAPKNTKFIIYFQSFSNSYAPLDNLKTLYQHALSKPNTIGISVGTRADCIEDGLLEFLDDLAKTKEIWIEIGVQSIFDKTLRLINRGESFEDIKKTMQKITQTRIKLCAHLIYGLPQENKTHFKQSLQEVVSLGTHSIKIHPLYVMKGTKLAKSHLEPLSESEYIACLVECLRDLPSHIIVQRLSAGIDSNNLLYPAWCKNKNTSLGKIRQALIKNAIKY